MFGNKEDKTGHTKYYLPTVEINYYNVMIVGKTVLIVVFFDQPAKMVVRAYKNIWKIATGQCSD